MIGAYAQLASSMLLVGVNVVVLKLLAESLPVTAIIALRCTIAAVLLLPLVAGRLAWPDRRVVLNLVGQAALGSLAYNELLVAGLTRTGALEAGLVLAALPVVVALLAVVLLREVLTVRQMLATVLAMAGMACLAMRGAGGAAQAGFGDALVLAAVLCEGLYVILAKAVAGRTEPMVGTFWMQAFSAGLMAPFAAVNWSPALPPPGVLALLLFHAVTASLLAVVLWYAGLRRVSGSVAGVFAALLPLASAATAVLVLHEAVTPAQAGGAGLLLLSLLLATWPGISRDPAQCAAPLATIASSSIGTKAAGDT